MQGTPGRDVRSYAEIQKYLQSDYSTLSTSNMEDNSSSTMSRVLARLNKSQGSTDGTGILLSESKQGTLETCSSVVEPKGKKGRRNMQK